MPHLAPSLAPSAPHEVPRSAPPGGRRDGAVTAWLLSCAALVAAMVVLGGVTRLTRSGLSIVEWRPIAGVLPPMGDAAWRDEFARYQGSPEFRLVNAAMTLAEFRSIFWVEWAHRLLGRVVGTVFLLPLVVLAARRRVTRRQVATWCGVFALGGLQGIVGWYMVASGLVDEPHVSPYRLTSHLLLALLLFSLLLRGGLGAWAPRDAAAPAPRTVRRARAAARAALAAVVATVAWGGLMAGHRAGLAAPTFPTMNGRLVPAGLFDGPLLAAVSDPLTVHFVHRALAYAAAVAVLAAAACAVRASRDGPVRAAATAAALCVALQVALGAATVLALVPVGLAAAHQANAVALLAALLVLLHALGRRPASPAGSAAPPATAG